MLYQLQCNLFHLLMFEEIDEERGIWHFTEGKLDIAPPPPLILSVKCSRRFDEMEVSSLSILMVPFFLRQPTPISLTTT